MGWSWHRCSHHPQSSETMVVPQRKNVFLVTSPQSTLMVGPRWAACKESHRTSPKLSGEVDRHQRSSEQSSEANSLNYDGTFLREERTLSSWITSRWRDSGRCWDHSPGAPVVPWVCSSPSLGFYLDLQSKQLCGLLRKPAYTSSKLLLFLCFSLSLQTWHLVLLSGSGVHLVKWATFLTSTGWTILAKEAMTVIA